MSHDNGVLPDQELLKGGDAMNPMNWRRYACDHHSPVPRTYCLMCFTGHPLIQRLRALIDRNEKQPPSPHCTDVTNGLSEAIEEIARTAWGAPSIQIQEEK